MDVRNEPNLRLAGDNSPQRHRDHGDRLSGFRSGLLQVLLRALRVSVVEISVKRTQFAGGEAKGKCLLVKELWRIRPWRSDGKTKPIRGEFQVWSVKFEARWICETKPISPTPPRPFRSRGGLGSFGTIGHAGPCLLPARRGCPWRRWCETNPIGKEVSSLSGGGLASFGRMGGGNSPPYAGRTAVTTNRGHRPWAPASLALRR